MAYLPTPGLRTNYQLVAGPATGGRLPAVFVHGLGANLAFWYLGAGPQVMQDRPVLMYDLRGHGASSTPEGGYTLPDLAADLRQLLDATGLGRVHLVGHSHGARVALAFALAHPGMVASLTIADTQLRALQPPMRLAEWPAWPRWKADLIRQGRTVLPPDDAEIDFRVLAELGPAPRARALAAPAPGTAVAGLPSEGEAPDIPVRPLGGGALRERGPGWEAAGRPRATPDLRVARMGDRGRKQWLRLLDSTTAATELEDEAALDPAEFRRLTMPSLLMFGELSHCLPTSDRLLDRLPQARRVVVPEAGHFFPLVKPRLFARTLRVFLGGADAQADRPAARPVLRRLAAARGRRRHGGAI